MSEYQYYEFQAIDRPLSQPELEHLRNLSSRAHITSHSFVNTYNWGDFKGRPERLMETCFDAFVYVANWGTHQLMFRVPRQLLDRGRVSEYLCGDSLKAWEKNEFFILEFLFQEEGGGDWVEGEGWMAALLPLRADLQRGDLRCLYLGWLGVVESRELADDDLEPPVPPGLQTLSGSLESLANFLRIDPDLIEVAAEASGSLELAAPSAAELSSWIATLAEPEKDALLLELLTKNDAYFLQRLLKRFEQETSPSNQGNSLSAKRRRVGELLSRAEALSAEKSRREAERRAAEEARRKQDQAAARAKLLNQLAGQEPQLWTKVELLVQNSVPKNYDEAIRLLVDLRDLATRSGQTAGFESRLRNLRQRYQRRSSLLARIDKAGLDRR